MSDRPLIVDSILADLPPRPGASEFSPAEISTFEGHASVAEEWLSFQKTTRRNQAWADFVQVYRLAGSNTEAWFVLVTDGFHQGSVYIAGAGPFFALEDLLKYCVRKIRKWPGWWVISFDDERARVFTHDIERLSGKVTEAGQR